jgi:hypothetical protein
MHMTRWAKDGPRDRDFLDEFNRIVTDLKRRRDYPGSPITTEGEHPKLGRTVGVLAEGGAVLVTERPYVS